MNKNTHTGEAMAGRVEVGVSFFLSAVCDFPSTRRVLVFLRGNGILWGRGSDECGPRIDATSSRVTIVNQGTLFARSVSERTKDGDRVIGKRRAEGRGSGGAL